VREILTQIVDPTTWAGALFFAAVFLGVAFLVSRGIRRLVGGVLARDKDVRIDRTAAHLTVRMLYAVVFLVALLFYAHMVPALRSLGTAMLASAGILTVVVGLAAQGTLGNLIAGITIMLYRPFKVGEIVQLQTPMGPETGTLERISLGYTILRTSDGRRVVVPNTVMAGEITMNLSSPDLLAVIDFHLAYGSDIAKARKLVATAAETHRSVTAIDSCLLTALGETGMVLSLRFVCESAASAYQTKLDLLEIVNQRFDDVGIDISYASTSIDLIDARAK